MSGGALDYVYSSVEDAAVEIGRNASPLHYAFAHHLNKVVKALHDIEWVMSGDYEPGDEIESMRAVLNDSDELLAAIELAEKSLENLQTAIKKAKDDVDK